MCKEVHNMICQQTYPPRQEEGVLLYHYFFDGHPAATASPAPAASPAGRSATPIDKKGC